jgi:3-deoxy-D-manno-octulosonic-acid transferase
MNFLYNFSIKAYQAGVKLVVGRNAKATKMIEGHAKIMDILNEKIIQGEKYIWIHVASLGEFEQGRPLIEMIKRENASRKIVLTFFSPSGYEIRKNYKEADVICYLPFDIPSKVTQFLDIVNPEMAIFVKYEFWGNYLEQLKQRGIPTYIISAIFRDSQVFFKGWGGMFRKMLNCFTHFFVQDENSKKLLKNIGLTNVDVCGDTRFDRVTDIMATTKAFPIVENFTKGKFTLIIGSSWQPDEDIIIPYFNSHPEMRLIIAPHEFDAERVKALQSRITRKSVLYTETNETEAAEADCLILNCFGILSSCYRYAQVAHIGGGFGVGIHNINEAAVYGMPVIFGPKYHKFKEAHDLIAAGGAFSIQSAEEFAAKMDKMLKDKTYLSDCGTRAKHYIESQLGATERIYNKIFK